MTMADFKKKYARFTPDGRQDLPICSDMPGYIGKSELHGEAWHRRANIIHARIDNPLEENSPTVAGVKTDLFLYQFVDGQLFRISAWFATDLFHLVSEAVLQKYGKPTSENQAAARADLGKQRLEDHSLARHRPPADLFFAAPRAQATGRARRIAGPAGLGRYLAATPCIVTFIATQSASSSRHIASALAAARG